MCFIILRSWRNFCDPQDEMFPVGIRVELQDLKAIAHMNGRRGTVCETPEENIGRPELAGRISVCLFVYSTCSSVCVESTSASSA
jgi:hypothetical protein